MQVGRYTVIRSLGQGGMAKVLLARSQQGDEVVLKVPLSSDPELFERLRDEARVGLRLSHPSVVETLDLFEHDGKPILVVNFIRGASLSQMRKVGPLPPSVVARIGRQIADGLATLHEATDEAGKNLGILHRDVTAGNILVDHSGDARLIDLGIARSTESQARRTRLGAVRGTLRYLAPELILGKPHSPATDLWSLGVVLWEACLGRRAVRGDQKEVLQAIRDHKVMRYQGDERVDPRLHDAIGALLAPEPQRLQKARAAANIFRRLETAFGESTTAAIAAVRRAEGVIADDEEEPGIGRNTAELLGASQPPPPESFVGEDDDTRVAPRKVTLPSENAAVETDADARPTIQMPATPPPSVLESLPTRQMPQVAPENDEANVFNEPTVRRPESFVKTTAGRPSLVDESPDDSMEDDPATIQMAPQEFPPEVQAAMQAAVSPAVASPGVARPREAQKTQALYGSSLSELATKANEANKGKDGAPVVTSTKAAAPPTTADDRPKKAPVPALKNPQVEKLQAQQNNQKSAPRSPSAPAEPPKVQAPPANVQHTNAPNAHAPAATARAAKNEPPPAAAAPPAAASPPAPAAPTPNAPPAAAASVPPTQTAAPPVHSPDVSGRAASLPAPPVATPAMPQPQVASAPVPAPPSGVVSASAPPVSPTTSPAPTDVDTAHQETEQIDRRPAAAETGAFDADDVDWKPKRTGLYAFIALLVFVLFGVFVMAVYSVFFDNPPQEPPAAEEAAENVDANEEDKAAEDEATKEVVEEAPPPPKKKATKRKRRSRRKSRK